MNRLSEAAAALGRQGGKSKSARKLAAIRENARGPHKRRPASQIKPESLKRRQMRDAARKCKTWNHVTSGRVRDITVMGPDPERARKETK